MTHGVHPAGEQITHQDCDARRTASASVGVQQPETAACSVIWTLSSTINIGTPAAATRRASPPTSMARDDGIPAVRRTYTAGTRVGHSVATVA
jgi:hypothetical protein